MILAQIHETPLGQVDFQRSNDFRQENIESACFIQHYAHYLAFGWVPQSFKNESLLTSK